jgi:hypothetical protein
VLKWLGKGLRLDPSRVTLPAGGAALDGRVLPIRVELLAAPPGHVAAVARRCWS